MRHSQPRANVGKHLMAACLLVATNACDGQPAAAPGDARIADSTLPTTEVASSEAEAPREKLDATTLPTTDGDASRDAGPDAADAADATDAGPITCEDARGAIVRDIYTEMRAEDVEACESHADCTILTLDVSCLGYCHRRAYSLAGAAHMQQWAATVEAERCAPFHARGCAAPYECVPPWGVPRCMDGECFMAPAWCPVGCTPDEDDVCRGKDYCDGCPYVPFDAYGKPCEPPNDDLYQCAQDVWCPDIVECVVPRDGTQRVWEPVVLLCSVEDGPG